MASTNGGFYLLPDYVSQYNKTLIFLSDSTGSAYINFGSSLNPSSSPVLYEINIQTYSYNSGTGTYGDGLGYYGRGYVLYNGSGTSLIVTPDTLTGIALSQSGTGVLRIDVTGSVVYGVVVSFCPTLKNTTRLPPTESPYLLKSYDISIYNKSILATSYTNGSVYINMANSGYNMGVECSYEVTVASIAGGFRYGCATVAINTLNGSDGVVSVITQSVSSDITFSSDSTFLLRIDVGYSGIPVYISFNRITNTPENSLAGGSGNTYGYDGTYYNSLKVQGIQFTTDVNDQFYINMTSTTDPKMNIPTGNDFFLYKILATTGSTNLIACYYVIVSAWSIGVLLSAQTNTNINIAVDPSTTRLGIIVTATHTASQIVTCSFQRMIDTTNSVAAPVIY